VLRVSVGIEDAGDLVADIAAGLERAAKLRAAEPRAAKPRAAKAQPELPLRRHGS